MLDRPSLKKRAVEIIGSSQPKLIYVTLAYLALTIIVGTLSARLLGVNISQEDFARYYQFVIDGNLEYASKALETMTPPFSSYAVDSLLSLMMSIVGTGFIIYLLNTIRSTGACLGNLLDGFGMFLRIIILGLLEGVFIALWSMLFIIPGIIAAYRYAMAIYLLIDHPEMSPLDCIRESKRLMTGHKAEFFILDLSFIGWHLLSYLPVLGYLVEIWTIPYIGLTKALYYEQLRGVTLAAPHDRIFPAQP